MPQGERGERTHPGNGAGSGDERTPPTSPVWGGRTAGPGGGIFPRATPTPYPSPQGGRRPETPTPILPRKRRRWPAGQRGARRIANCAEPLDAALRSSSIQGVKRLVLTLHAEAKLHERGILFPWVERVARDPAWTEPEPYEPSMQRRSGTVEDFGGRMLRVVCVETADTIRVIMATFDRRARRPT